MGIRRGKLVLIVCNENLWDGLSVQVITTVPKIYKIKEEKKGNFSIISNVNSNYTCLLISTRFLRLLFSQFFQFNNRNLSYTLRIGGPPSIPYLPIHPKISQNRIITLQLCNHHTNAAGI